MRSLSPITDVGPDQTRTAPLQLRFGTRGSALALWQTQEVIKRLHAVRPDVACPTVTVNTRGDDALHIPLTAFKEEGVFTDALEAALLNGTIDVAVHSLKDLPTHEAPGLILGAMPCRADPRDVLVTREGVQLVALPAGAVVGTCSIRRSAQLLALRPDLIIRPIRGTVEARLQKVLDGEYDATILAAAGLERLGLLKHVSQYFEPDVLLPAPGQGILAVQCRADDVSTLSLLATIDDPAVRAAAQWERSHLHALERKRIVVTRPRAQAFTFGAALARYGAVPIICPAIRIEPIPESAALRDALQHLDRYDWIVFTSVNAVTQFWSHVEAHQIPPTAFTHARIAAVGPATAVALTAIGLSPQLVPERYVAEELAATFGEVRGQSLLLPRSVIARGTLPALLRAAGASVDDVPLYQIVTETPDPAMLEELRAGVDVVTFTSASTVRGFVSLLGPQERAGLANAHIACIGPITAAAARDAGFQVDILADEYTTDGVVQALVHYFRTHDRQPTH
ncbi:MAG TPA: hydroxymethylbilane synthase [Gemmatimonadaceae bacterium]|nr:hydroxymethylbilane synthase [Gemmatimonadaceae bacterium]